MPTPGEPRGLDELELLPQEGSGQAPQDSILQSEM
jgi:hypothetical protein